MQVTATFLMGLSPNIATARRPCLDSPRGLLEVNELATLCQNKNMCPKKIHFVPTGT